MGKLFGVAIPPPTVAEEVQAKVRQLKLDRLKLDALNLIPAAMAEQADRLRTYMQEWEADKAAYSFACARHGDFLACFMERDGKKLVKALNLMQALTFTLKLGREPNREGTVSPYLFRKPIVDSFGLNILSSRGSGIVNYASEIDPDLLEASIAYDYTFNYQKTRMMSDPPMPQVGNGGDGWHSGRIYGCYYPEVLKDMAVPTVALPARDDRVSFSSGVTLWAPAGLGWEVYEKVLRAGPYRQ